MKMDQLQIITKWIFVKNLLITKWLFVKNLLITKWLLVKNFLITKWLLVKNLLIRVYAYGILQVGICYERGIGVKQDEHKAFIYYQKSAEMGNANGTNNVGYGYEYGIGVEKDEHKAFIYYQKSAEMGNSDGICNLGCCYINGFGVEKDEHKAFNYFQKSAEMGNANGIFNVGCCYDNGVVVEKDEHKAFIYYQKSAEMGIDHGAYNTGTCYLNGIGVEKNEYEAFNYYKKSADLGNADGACNVGYFYCNGIGVKKDERKAFIYYQKSAEMGNADGTCNVGFCYYSGIGVEMDVHNAFSYYQKSAEMNCSGAIFQIGNCYLFGKGVEKDERKAFVYYEKSAKMKDLGGISQLAYCYRNGIGIMRDIEKSNEWYQKEKFRLSELSVTYNWINETSDIDDNLKNILLHNKHSLLWIPYNEFKIIKVIGKGGFAIVYGAKWLDRNKKMINSVALKLLHGSNQCQEEFIKELKGYCDIGYKNPSFLKCFGISRDDASKDYILVLKYAKSSLRNNLHEIAQMKWKDKLNLLLCIASDLQIIHSHTLIHRDLHSGNILQDNIYNAYIADLGLSIQSNLASKMGAEEVYGVLPYIAPEIFNKEPYTTASDIYSFGIIMWEVLYGNSVYWNREFNNQLQIEICCQNLRPNIDKGTPKCYINLMKECWEKCPENRPTADEIYDIFTKWKDDEKILLELSESENVLKDILNTHDSTFIESNYRSRSYYPTDQVLRIIETDNTFRIIETSNNLYNQGY